MSNPAYGSDAWKDFLESLRGGGGGDLYQTSTGGLGSGLSDNSGFDKTKDRLATNKGARAALGMEEPEEQEGFLSGALKALQTPRSIIVGGITGAWGMDDGDNNPNNDSAFSRIKQAAGGREYSSRDFGPLKKEKDDGWGTNALKATGGFLTDAVFDPLTYVSGGGSVLGKTAAANVIEELGKKGALSGLDSATAKKLAGSHHTRSVVGDTTKLVKDKVKLGSDETAEELSQGLLKNLDAPDDLTAASEVVGSRLASAYQTKGALGLRREFIDIYGKEAGEKKFKELPRDLQGGLRIRVPFGRQNGVPMAFGVGGGGKLAEKVGADKALLKAQDWRTSLAASGPITKLRDGLGGADGPAGSDLWRAYRDQPEKAAEAFAKFSKTRSILRDARVEGMPMARADQATVLTVANLLKDATDKARVRSESVKLAETGKLEPRPRAAFSSEEAYQDHLVAVRIAAKQREYYDQSYRELSEHVDLRQATNYVSHQLTEDAKARKQASRKLFGGRQTSGAGAATTNPLKARTYVVFEKNPKTGELYQRTLTIDEVNAGKVAQGLPIEFDDDPVKMIANFAASKQRIIARARVTTKLEQAGYKFSNEFLQRRSVRLQGAQRLAEEALKAEGKYQDGLGNEANFLGSEAQRLRDEVEAERVRFQQAEYAAEKGNGGPEAGPAGPSAPEGPSPSGGSPAGPVAPPSGVFDGGTTWFGDAPTAPTGPLFTQGRLGEEAAASADEAAEGWRQELDPLATRVTPLEREGMDPRDELPAELNPFLKDGPPAPVEPDPLAREGVEGAEALPAELDPFVSEWDRSLASLREPDAAASSAREWEPALEDVREAAEGSIAKGKLNQAENESDVDVETWLDFRAQEKAEAVRRNLEAQRQGIEDSINDDLVMAAPAFPWMDAENPYLNKARQARVFVTPDANQLMFTDLGKTNAIRFMTPEASESNIRTYTEKVARAQAEIDKLEAAGQPVPERLQRVADPSRVPVHTDWDEFLSMSAAVRGEADPKKFLEELTDKASQAQAAYIITNANNIDFDIDSDMYLKTVQSPAGKKVLAKAGVDADNETLLDRYVLREASKYKPNDFGNYDLSPDDLSEARRLQTLANDLEESDDDSTILQLSEWAKEKVQPVDVDIDGIKAEADKFRKPTAAKLRELADEADALFKDLGKPNKPQLDSRLKDAAVKFQEEFGSLFWQKASKDENAGANFEQWLTNAAERLGMETDNLSDFDEIADVVRRQVRAARQLRKDADALQKSGATLSPASVRALGLDMDNMVDYLIAHEADEVIELLKKNPDYFDGAFVKKPKLTEPLVTNKDLELGELGPDDVGTQSSSQKWIDRIAEEKAKLAELEAGTADDAWVRSQKDMHRFNIELAEDRLNSGVGAERIDSLLPDDEDLLPEDALNAALPPELSKFTDTPRVADDDPFAPLPDDSMAPDELPAWARVLEDPEAPAPAWASVNDEDPFNMPEAGVAPDEVPPPSQLLPQDPLEPDPFDVPLDVPAAAVGPDGLPPVEPGMVRLYRAFGDEQGGRMTKLIREGLASGEASGNIGAADEWLKNMDEMTGRSFSTDINEARSYLGAGRGIGTNHTRLGYVDVPEDVAAQANIVNQSDFIRSQSAHTAPDVTDPSLADEHVLPAEWASKLRDIPEVPAAGGAGGAGRGGGDDLPPPPDEPPFPEWNDGDFPDLADPEGPMSWDDLVAAREAARERLVEAQGKATNASKEARTAWEAMQERKKFLSEKQEVADALSSTEGMKSYLDMVMLSNNVDEQVQGIDDLMTVLIEQAESRKSALREGGKDYTGAEALLKKLRDQSEYITERQPEGRFNGVFEELGLVRAGEGKQDYRPPVGAGGEAMELYVVPEARRLVERMYKATHDETETKKFIDGVYQPAYTLFKTYATVGRGPGYHARNIIGGLWQNFAGDVTVKDHTLSAKMDYIIEKSLRDAKKASPQDVNRQYRLAEQLASAELRKVQVGDSTLEDAWLAMREHEMHSSQTTDALNLRNFDPAEGLSGDDIVAQATNRRSAFKKPLSDRNAVQRGVDGSLNWWGIRASTKVGQASENWLRGAAVISGLRKYGGGEQGRNASAMWAKALHFDYQDLSDFERQYMKNVLPFYVWMRKNIPLQFRILATEPGKVNKLIGAHDAVASMFEVPEDDRGGFLPSYMDDRLAYITRFGAGEKNDAIALGLESPVTDLNKMFNNDITDPVEWKELVGASNPFAKAAANYAFGRDIQTGASRENTTDAPEWMTPFLGDAMVNEEGKEQVNARGLGLAKDLLPPLSTLQGVTGSGPRGDATLKTSLMTNVGIPAYTVSDDLAEAQARGQLSDEEAELVSYATKQGVTMRQVRGAINAGFSPAEVRAAIESGQLAENTRR